MNQPGIWRPKIDSNTEEESCIDYKVTMYTPTQCRLDPIAQTSEVVDGTSGHSFTLRE